MKKELPFEKYKTHLFDYLRLHGINAESGQMICCPWHDDPTPSLSFFTDSDGFPRFKCFGCGKQGDIYSAVEFCEGITDAKKQFEEIENIFGTGGDISKQFVPPPKKEKYQFVPDREKLAKLQKWLDGLEHKKENILSYFRTRAEYKTAGEQSSYPLNPYELERLASFFYWWPGASQAVAEFGNTFLFSAGVPYKKSKNGSRIVEEFQSAEDFPKEGAAGKIYLEQKTDTCFFWNETSKSYEKAKEDPREVAWWHSGILAKSPDGMKLLYMNEKDFESMKVNPRTGVSFFPIPGELPTEKPIVLMEGEIDAILCQSIGIGNAFSMGGLGNLSVPKIKKFLIPKKIPEIILFADNDKAPKCQSQKAFGMMPYAEGDAVVQTVPEKLLEAGFEGKIKVTSLPSECPYKDPDDAIRNGKRQLVFDAIANALDYVAPKKPEKKTAKKEAEKAQPKKIRGTVYQEWDTIPLKFYKSLLKKFKWSNLQEEDKKPFICAAYKACKEDGALDALISFTNNDFDKEAIEKASELSATPFYLLELGEKYELSKFIIDKLEEHLVPAKEILRIFKIEETVVPVDYEAMAENENLIAFIEKKDNFFAACVIADATDGNIIYVENEKAHYAFRGVAWERLPGLAVEAHKILQNILLTYLEKNLSQKDVINRILKQIGSRRFRLDLVKDFNEFRGQTYREDIMFDSVPIQATLTLQDGVIDFSGDKLIYRKANRDEYRRSVLPYTIAQVKKAGRPEKFLKLIDGDFEKPNIETLKRNSVTTVKTLLYYLSLIQSRNTQYKYGGFFLGHGGTGKSTLCSLIDAIYSEDCVQLQNEILISVGKHFQASNGPTPEIAKLEGKLIAFVQETPKDGRLNTNTFKLLTGGDKLSARKLNREPHEFFPTAQILISSNNSPDFEHGDDAAIKRMIIFRFNIEHEKGLKESKTPKEFIEELRPEFPAIIKMLAEHYIELHTVFKGKIPMSTECVNEKNLYVQEQEKDTDRFVKLCIRYAFTDNDAFITSRDLYLIYLNLLGIQEGSKEAATQRQFTTWLKADYKEFRRSYKQKRLDGSANPEWGFEHIALTDYGKELLKQTPPAPSDQLDFDQSATPPDDDPFANASFAPPPKKKAAKKKPEASLKMPELEEDTGNDDFDIY